MGAPNSLLQEARGFARDYPRDRMPQGLLWDMTDYVPSLLDAQLTGRGGWTWASDPVGGDVEAGIHAPFVAGSRLLLCGADGGLWEAVLGSPPIGSAPITFVGTIPRTAQNPIFIADNVIIPDRAGAAVPTKVTAAGGALAIGTLHASAAHARYAVAWKGRVILGNAPGAEHVVRYGAPDDVTAAWDVNAFDPTDQPITGLGALRSVLLVFHAGSVERIRGSAPPGYGLVGDFNLENLFDRAGCGDAKSIAYWNDNCLFADERGVHLTDGAIVRNLISQGGLIAFWRNLYRQAASIAAATYLDYYIVTVIRQQDGVSVTLVCDLNKRTWFRFTNILALSYIHSVGMQENIWAGRRGTARLMALAPCFFPLTTNLVEDGDGSDVLPVIETPWFRFGAEGRKRIRYLYTSYDVRGADVSTGFRFEADNEGVVLDTPENLNVQAVAALQKVLEVGYITSPQETSYTAAGQLPVTNRYKRYRLPINKNPYGLALRIRQVSPSSVTRLFDYGIEQQADEKSRV